MTSYLNPPGYGGGGYPTTPVKSLPSTYPSSATGAGEADGNRAGNTPLHLAAMTGQLQAVEALLQQRSDPNAVNLDGRTPLDAAILAGQGPAVLSALQRAGARAPWLEADDARNAQIETQLWAGPGKFLGAFQKRGGGTTFMGRKSWKLRWFLIDQRRAVLSYFEKQPSGDGSGAPLKGELSLTGSTVTESPDEHAPPPPKNSPEAAAFAPRLIEVSFPSPGEGGPGASPSSPMVPTPPAGGTANPSGPARGEKSALVLRTSTDAERDALVSALGAAGVATALRSGGPGGTGFVSQRNPAQSPLGSLLLLRSLGEANYVGNRAMMLIAAALRRHGDAPAVVELASGLTQGLVTKTPSFRGAFLAAYGVRALGAALASARESHAAVAAALATLRLLADAEGARGPVELLAGGVGTVGALVAALERSTGTAHGPTATWGAGTMLCSLMGAVGGGPAVMGPFTQSAGVPTVVAALKASLQRCPGGQGTAPTALSPSEDAPAAAEVTCALLSLVSRSPGAPDAIAAAGGVPVLLEALRVHLSTPAVAVRIALTASDVLSRAAAASASTALAMAAAAAQPGAAAVGSGGGVNRTSGASSSSMASEGPGENPTVSPPSPAPNGDGGGAGFPSSSSSATAAALAASGLGALGPLVASLLAHSANRDICANGVAVLGRVVAALTAAAAPPPARDARITTFVIAALPMLIVVGQTHGADPSITAGVTGLLLAYLSRTAPAEGAVAEAPAVISLLQAALQRHGAAADAGPPACAGLWFAVGREGCPLPDAKSATAVVAGLQAHVGLQDYAQRACDVIGRVGREQGQAGGAGPAAESAAVKQPRAKGSPLSSLLPPLPPLLVRQRALGLLGRVFALYTADAALVTSASHALRFLAEGAQDERAEFAETGVAALIKSLAAHCSGALAPGVQGEGPSSAASSSLATSAALCKALISVVNRNGAACLRGVARCNGAGTLVELLTRAAAGSRGILGAPESGGGPASVPPCVPALSDALCEALWAVVAAPENAEGAMGAGAPAALVALLQHCVAVGYGTPPGSPPSSVASPLAAAVASAACGAIFVLCCHGTLYAGLATAGAVPALIGALRVHASTPAVVEMSCGALSTMAEASPALRAAQLEAGAVPALVGALMLHVADRPPVAEAACGALRRLAAAPEGQLAIARVPSGVKALASCLVSDTAAVVAEGCLTLLSVASHPETQAVWADGEVATTLIIALRKFASDALVAGAACGALGSILASGAVSPATLARNSVFLPTLIGALRTHAGQRYTCEAGSYVLLRVAGESPELAGAIVTAKGLGTLCVVLSRVSDSPVTVERVCRILRCFLPEGAGGPDGGSGDPDPAPRPSVPSLSPSLVVKQEDLPLLAAALQARPESPDAQTVLALLVRGYASIDAKHAAGLSLHAGSLLPALVTGARRQVADAACAEAACGVLRLCTPHADNRASIARADGVGLLVASLSAYPTSPTIARNGVTALGHIAAGDASPQVLAAGGAPRIVACLQRFVEDVCIAKEAAVALLPLAKRPDGAAALAKTDAAAALVAMLTHHKENGPLVEACVSALRAAAANLPAEFCPALARAGGLEPLLECLRLHLDLPAIVEPAATLLTQCAGQKESWEAAQKLDCIGPLLAVTTRHHTRPEIAGQVGLVLKLATSGSAGPEGADAVFRAEGLGPLVTALRFNAQANPVIAASLLAVVAAVAARGHAAEVVQTGVTEPLTLALSRFGADPSVVCQAAALLRALCSPSGNGDDSDGPGVREVVRCGGVKTLLGFSREKRHGPLVAEAAVGALAHLAAIPSLQPELLKGGIVAAVVFAMGVAGNNSDVSHHVCEVLNCMAVEDAAAVAQSGGVGALVKSLTTHGAYAPIAETACSALLRVIRGGGASARNEFTRTGAVEGLVKGALAVHVGSSAIAELACDTLAAYAVSPQSRRSLASCGGIRAIVATLQGHLAEAGLAETCVGLLRGMAGLRVLRGGGDTAAEAAREAAFWQGQRAGGEEGLGGGDEEPCPMVPDGEDESETGGSYDLLMPPGALSAIMAALAAYPARVALNEAGIAALGTFAAGRCSRKDAVAHAGAVSVIVAAMNSLGPGCAPLARDACAALGNLCSSPAMASAGPSASPTASASHCGEVQLAGGVAAVMRMLAVHAADPSVALFGVYALRNACPVAAREGPPTACSLADPAPLMQALETHGPSDPRLAAIACGAILRLTRNHRPNAGTIVGGSDGLGALIRVVGQYSSPAHPPALLTALEALCALAAQDPGTCLPAIAQAGGIPVLLGALRAPWGSSSPDAIHGVCVLLRHVAGASEGLRDVVRKEGAIELMEKLLQGFQGAAFEALQNDMKWVQWNARTPMERGIKFMRKPHD